MSRIDWAERAVLIADVILELRSAAAMYGSIHQIAQGQQDWEAMKTAHNAEQRASRLADQLQRAEGAES